MIKLLAQLRKDDKHGSGAFGAPRGRRLHRGIDYAAYPNSYVCSLLKGTVTKIGYPYDPNDPKKGTFRYVEVTTDHHRLRYFYVYPLVTVGEIIQVDEVIGVVQDLRDLYHNITPHVHLEVKNSDGEYLDPMQYITDRGLHRE